MYVYMCWTVSGGVDGGSENCSGSPAVGEGKKTGEQSLSSPMMCMYIYTCSHHILTLLPAMFTLHVTAHDHSL